MPGQRPAVLPHQRPARTASCPPAAAPWHRAACSSRRCGNGAYFLGRTDLLDTPRADEFAWRGTVHRSVTTLTVDRTDQLLRRRRVWTADDGSAPVEQRSAWRLLFPQELRHLLAAHGYEVLELHGRTRPAHRTAVAGGPAPRRTTDADRLHVVARLTCTTTH
ncbi:hypothetical protein GCM10023238_06540 [Streptomyces heliomycini]